MPILSPSSLYQRQILPRLHVVKRRSPSLLYLTQVSGPSWPFSRIGRIPKFPRGSMHNFFFQQKCAPHGRRDQPLARQQKDAEKTYLLPCSRRPGGLAFLPRRLSRARVTVTKMAATRAVQRARHSRWQVRPPEVRRAQCGHHLSLTRISALTQLRPGVQQAPRIASAAAVVGPPAPPAARAGEPGRQERQHAGPRVRAWEPRGDLRGGRRRAARGHRAARSGPLP